MGMRLSHAVRFVLPLLAVVLPLIAVVLPLLDPPAAQAQTTFMLTVTIEGTGSGVVQISPSGTNCTETCTQTFAAGTPVSLIPTGSVGSVRTDWTGDCSGQSCNLTMNGNKQVAITFEKVLSFLTVETNGSGSGAVTGQGIACGTDCSETYSVGNTVTLTATTSIGSAFTGWSGACTGTGACVLRMDDDRQVTATFTRVYTLTVNISGSGSGVVTSTPPGLNCTQTCTQTYPAGTTLSLLPTGNPNSARTPWTGDCTGSDCTLMMTADKQVSVSFERIFSTLTVVKAGSGSGTVGGSGISCGTDCTDIYPFGSDALLFATPDAGSVFTGWSGGNCFGTGACRVTMNVDTTVTATFTRTYTLTVNIGGSGGGVVQFSPSGADCTTTCTRTYDAGTTVSLVALGNNGSVRTAWGGACSGNAGCSVTMDADKQVSIAFERVFSTLTVVKAGTGSGTVGGSGISCGTDCTDIYPIGTDALLFASPAPGSVFAGWSGGGCSGTADSCRVRMDDDTTVTATFARLYTLTVNIGGSGSGLVQTSPSGADCTVTCTRTYPDGTTLSLLPTANPNSVRTAWSGDCTGSDCTLTMNADKQVSISFERAFSGLTVVKAGSGSGTVAGSGISCGTNCSSAYPIGTDALLFATPDTGSVFAGWSGGGCSGTADSCRVTLNDDTTVTATFNTAPTPIDTVAPTTIGTTAPVNANTVRVTLTATDAGTPVSGVKEIVYSTTGAQVTASTRVPGATTSFNLPTTGTTTVTFSAVDNAGNTEAPKTLTVEATAGKPTSELTPNAIDFGNVVVGQPSPSRTVLLTNTGALPVTLSAVAVEGSSEFAVGSLSLPIAIQPGQTQAIGVRLTPAATGVRTAKLVVTDNATG